MPHPSLIHGLFISVHYVYLFCVYHHYVDAACEHFDAQRDRPISVPKKEQNGRKWKGNNRKKARLLLLLFFPGAVGVEK